MRRRERQVSREDDHEHHARADARGVGGDEVAGFRNGNLKIRGDGVQDRHHRKFCDAERERAERQNKNVERHEGFFFCFRWIDRVHHGKTRGTQFCLNF